MTNSINVLTSHEVDPSGKYRCPSCLAQSTSERADSGWIACPIYAEKVICLGCCFDLHLTALSDEFATQPLREEFEAIAAKGGNGVLTARLICLEHQLEMTLSEIDRPRHPRHLQDMRDLIGLLKMRISEASELLEEEQQSEDRD